SASKWQRDDVQHAPQPDAGIEEPLDVVVVPRTIKNVAAVLVVGNPTRASLGEILPIERPPVLSFDLLKTVPQMIEDLDVPLRVAGIDIQLVSETVSIRERRAVPTAGDGSLCLVPILGAGLPARPVGMFRADTLVEPTPEVEVCHSSLAERGCLCRR